MNDAEYINVATTAINVETLLSHWKNYVRGSYTYTEGHENQDKAQMCTEHIYNRSPLSQSMNAPFG